VVQLDIFGRPTNTTHPSSSTVVRHFGYKYKVGREGNLTLLYPTQEMMENILSGTSTLPRTPQPHVINYTLTVYWYLNSSIVYKDAFNLTKRGYNVDKVAIADVTFVLHNTSPQRRRPSTASTLRSGTARHPQQDFDDSLRRKMGRLQIQSRERR
jgi:hypothetical protein